LEASFVPDTSSPVGYPNNLPIQLTSFIGRCDELAELGRLLSESRLLTLMGVAGVGKTRVALQTASEVLRRFPGGVWMVPLASLTDASLIPSAMAVAIGLGEDPSRPLPDLLSDYLGDRSLLLVMDNCEHLIDGCAALVEHLLHACPALHILTTSREVLNLPGEIVWPVPPLSLPNPDLSDGAREALKSEGVQLFVERAQAAWPRFTFDNENAPAVAQICRRLDGIPLAIELAAARVRVLRPEEIAERLDDRFQLLAAGSRTGEPRHQTLRALVDWSYELLSEDEQLLFRRLSVFANGWTLEAAEAICAGGGIAHGVVLRLLGQLVDKSLVVVTDAGGRTRYGLLETLRQYAAEKLAESGEAPELRHRHLRWFRELVEGMQPALSGPDQAVLMGRLETELSNIRIALDWSKTGPNALDEGLRLGGALGIFWYFLGHAAEGEGWLSGLLALAPSGRDGHNHSSSSEAGRAAVLMALGSLMVLQQRPGEARAVTVEALALWRALGNSQGVAYSLLRLGQAAQQEGELQQAEASLEESLVVSRQLDSQGLMGAALRELGVVAQARRDFERAQTLFEESLRLTYAEGGLRRVALALTWLAGLAVEQGAPQVARARLSEALSLAERSGLRVGFAPALEILACLSAMESQPAHALRLAGAAASATGVLGAREALYTRWLRTAEPHLEMARKTLGERAAAAAWAEGEAMSLEQALNYAHRQPPARSSSPDGLTVRELEVLRLLGTGESNREIAEHLVLSARTAERHVASIYRKIGARRRADAVAYALRLGLSEAAPLRST
jgi:predicted ATPase/DNA-binding CsgD family transcriptional regulator